MKKTIQKLTLGLLFTLLTLPQNACDECGTELCDLISEITIQGSLAIFAGTPFNVSSLITNVAGLAQCGGEIMVTQSSPSSRTNFKVEQQVSANVYDSYFSNNYDTPVIPATGDNIAEGNYAATINEPGTYRIITFADAEYDATEREEDNNQSNQLNGSVGKTSNELIIQILPNPNPGVAERLIGRPTVEVEFTGYKLVNRVN